MAIAVRNVGNYIPLNHPLQPAPYVTNYTIPATLAGSTIVVFVCQDDSEGVPASYAPTDNQGNTYFALTGINTNGNSPGTAGAAHISGYFAYNVAASTTTISVAVGGLAVCCCNVLPSTAAIICYELTGLGTSSPADGVGNANGGANALANSGNITTTRATGVAASEIVIGAVNTCFSPSGPTYATDVGFTSGGNRNVIGAISVLAVKSEYQLVATNGTFTVSMTSTGGAAANSKVLAISAFGVAAAVTAIRRQLMLTGVGR
jgi:hypothetical protein